MYLSGDVYQGKIIVNYNKKGDWFNNKKQGYGTLLKADGSKFQGLFQDSYQQGKIIKVRKRLNDFGRWDGSRRRLGSGHFNTGNIVYC